MSEHKRSDSSSSSSSSSSSDGDSDEHDLLEISESVLFSFPRGVSVISQLYSRFNKSGYIYSKHLARL
jgi:hypothetical protein